MAANHIIQVEEGSGPLLSQQTQPTVMGGWYPGAKCTEQKNAPTASNPRVSGICLPFSHHLGSPNPSKWKDPFAYFTLLQSGFRREGCSWRKLPVDNVQRLYCQHYAIIYDGHHRFVVHTLFLFHLTQTRSQHHQYRAVIANWAISRLRGMDKWGHSKVKPSSVSCKWPLFCFVLSGLKEEVNLPIRIAWKHVLIGQRDEYV